MFVQQVPLVRCMIDVPAIESIFVSALIRRPTRQLPLGKTCTLLGSSNRLSHPTFGLRAPEAALRLAACSMETSYMSITLTFRLSDQSVGTLPLLRLNWSACSTAEARRKSMLLSRNIMTRAL